MEEDASRARATSEAVPRDKYEDALRMTLELSREVSRLRAATTGESSQMHRTQQRGVLLKQSGKRKIMTWQKRYCVLTSMGLMYYHKEQVKGWIVPSEILGIRPAARVNDKKSALHAFDIVTRQRTYTFCGLTSEDSDSWVEAITSTLALIGLETEDVTVKPIERKKRRRRNKNGESAELALMSVRFEPQSEEVKYKEVWNADDVRLSVTKFYGKARVVHPVEGGIFRVIDVEDRDMTVWICGSVQGALATNSACVQINLTTCVIYLSGVTLQVEMKEDKCRQLVEIFRAKCLFINAARPPCLCFDPCTPSNCSHSDQLLPADESIDGESRVIRSSKALAHRIRVTSDAVQDRIDRIGSAWMSRARRCESVQVGDCAKNIIAGAKYVSEATLQITRNTLAVLDRGAWIVVGTTAKIGRKGAQHIAQSAPVQFTAGMLDRNKEDPAGDDSVSDRSKTPSWMKSTALTNLIAELSDVAGAVEIVGSAFADSGTSTARTAKETMLDAVHYKYGNDLTDATEDVLDTITAAGIASFNVYQLAPVLGAQAKIASSAAKSPKLMISAVKQSKKVLTSKEVCRTLQGQMSSAATRSVDFVTSTEGQRVLQKEAGSLLSKANSAASIVTAIEELLDGEVWCEGEACFMGDFVGSAAGAVARYTTLDSQMKETAKELDSVTNEPSADCTELLRNHLVAKMRALKMEMSTATSNMIDVYETLADSVGHVLGEWQPGYVVLRKQGLLMYSSCAKAHDEVGKHNPTLILNLCGVVAVSTAKDVPNTLKMSASSYCTALRFSSEESVLEWMSVLVTVLQGLNPVSV